MFILGFSELGLACHKARTRAGCTLLDIIRDMAHEKLLRPLLVRISLVRAASLSLG